MSRGRNLADCCTRDPDRLNDADIPQSVRVVSSRRLPGRNGPDRIYRAA